VSDAQAEEALEQFDNDAPQSEDEEIQLTEEEAIEEKWQERMANTYIAMLITIAPACLGWALLMLSTYVLDNMFFAFIACLICVAPVLYSYMTSGWSQTLFFWRDYEVITTYSDGRKSSDGGAESAMMGLLYKLMMFGLVCMLAGIVSIGKCIYLPIKYTVCYLKVKNKPDLKNPKKLVRTGFFLAAVGFLTFIGAPIVGSTINNIQIRQKIIADNKSDYPADQIRKMVEDAQAKMLANNNCAAFSVKNYYHESNYYEIDVDCQNDGRIEVAVSFKYGDSAKQASGDDKSPSFMELGVYTFKNGEFVNLNRSDEKKPSDADIKAAAKFLPQDYFFSKIKSAKDEQLKAKNWETSEQNLKRNGRVVEVYVRDADDPSIKDHSKYPNRSKTVEYQMKIKEGEFQGFGNIRVDGNHVDLR
jgi:hypothetical protein